MARIHFAVWTVHRQINQEFVERHSISLVDARGTGFDAVPYGTEITREHPQQTPLFVMLVLGGDPHFVEAIGTDDLPFGGGFNSVFVPGPIVVASGAKPTERQLRALGTKRLGHVLEDSGVQGPTGPHLQVQLHSQRVTNGTPRLIPHGGDVCAPECPSHSHAAPEATEQHAPVGFDYGCRACG